MAFLPPVFPPAQLRRLALTAEPGQHQGGRQEALSIHTASSLLIFMGLFRTQLWNSAALPQVLTHSADSISS